MAYISTLYKTGSTLYFVQDLPALQPGSSISPTGIHTGMLAKNEADFKYYTKTQADDRFINELGDLFEGEIYLNPKIGNAGRYVGVRFTDAGDFGLASGFGWKNNDATPQLIGFIRRGGVGADSILEIGISREDGSSPVVLKLKPNGIFTTSRIPVLESFGDFLTWGTGIKKGGDIITSGIYEYNAGKINFKSLTETDESYRTVLVLDFLNDGVRDVIDLKGNYIMGSGSSPNSNDELVSKGFSDNTYIKRTGDTVPGTMLFAANLIILNDISEEAVKFYQYPPTHIVLGDFKGKAKIVNALDPIESGDYVTLRFLKSELRKNQIRSWAGY